MNMTVPAGASGTLHWAGSGRAYYNLQPGQIISVERADLVDLASLACRSLRWRLRLTSTTSGLARRSFCGRSANNEGPT